VTDRAKPLPGSVPADAFDVAVGALNRGQRRSRRKREVRATTISIKRMTKRELESGRVLYPEVPHWRPTTRGDCERVARPCPFVSCRYNLFIDVSPRTGAIKLNYPDLEPDQMGESCCLDIADQGGATLEHVGALVNLTRERIRQIETKAFRRLLNLQRRELLEHVGDEARVPVRHLPEAP
jgi:hypothetical protein